MATATVRAWLPHITVMLAGLWAAGQGVGFVLNPATRHRAESAWFIFAGVLLLSGLSLGRRVFRSEPDATTARDAFRAVIPFVLIVCSLILYSPVLGIGLLSDDFVLLQRAGENRLIDSAWDYVRPLPLAWWLLVDATIPSTVAPVVLHLLNFALHGLNASLVLLCALRLRLPVRASWLSALLFLAWPSSVEAVAWASGVFDLALTTCVLTSAVVMLSDRCSPLARVTLVALLSAVAVASKETAIALPLLLTLLVPFVARDHQRSAILSVVAAVIVVLLYAAWRLSFGVSSAHLIPTSGYAAKEILSRPFGAIGLAIHSDVLAAVPILAPLVVIAWPIGFAAAALKWRHEPQLFRIVVLGASWVLVSTLPLSTMLFVSSDLQGSRYLYLGTAMWSIAVVTIITGVRGPTISTSATTAAMIIISAAAAIVLAHQRPWARASEIRDRVLDGLRRLPRECGVIEAAGLPDNEDGAYVFRNGFAEAAALVRGVPTSTAIRCVATWDGSRFVTRP